MSRSTLQPLAAAALLLAATGCGGGRPATGPTPAPAPAAGAEQLGREPAIEAARPVPVSSSLLGSAHYDLPLEANQWVAAELDFLVTQRHEVIGQWLQRADYYDQFVQDVFGRYGIPKDLHHLAMVESGYTTGAHSRAGAVGMWQFMAGTARGMGLRVDDVVDERMDPVRATHAAARHLRDLNQAFNGDWALAVAAYNAGSGRISRGLRSYSVSNFWDLAQQGNLADETKRYVPRLYAVTIIAHDPARFGYAAPAGPVRRFAYDSVRVDVVTPLTDLAGIGGLPLAELATLNPHLVRGLAPAGYWVWTPAGTGAATQQAFQSSEFRRSGGADFYTVRRGDDVAKLADLVGIPADRIREMNPRVVVGGSVASGQKLALPAAAARFLSARPVERVAVRDDSTADTDSTTGLVRRRDRSQASGSGNATNDDTDAAPRTTRTANSGRTERTDASSERPARSEDAERPSRPRTSERTGTATRTGDADRPARAPESSDDEKPVRSTASTSTRSGRTGDSEASSPRSTRRASESGDDGGAAPAKPRRTTDGESASAARTRSGSRTASDDEAKPPRTSSRSASSESGSRTSATREYVVKEDETLFAIARRFGVTVTQIREANDLGSSSVRPGRKLRIPRAARSDASDDDTPARERSSAGSRARSSESSSTRSRGGESSGERPRSGESSSERTRSEGSSASRPPTSGESARGEGSSAERSRTRASGESSSGESSSSERRRASGDVERSSGERSSASKPGSERAEPSRGEAARNARVAGERAAERTSGEGASTRTRRTNGDGDSKPSREGESARREGSSTRGESGSSREGSSASRSEGGRTRATEHTVKSGETLYSIARQYSVTVAALREANDLGERTSIAPGRKLRIPAPKS
ncbi:MAG TPA: LysM peptidoglycan-binding domain-containing protein [Longimicrobiaceae bacterium]|nr:LysM peptidoglycan-binding domain-containing protein [Longimicrobiaceae bacterium]